MEALKVKVRRRHDGAILPTYATDGSGAFDLYAADVNGFVGQTRLAVNELCGLTCGTGLAFEIPPGYVMLVFSRSGHGFKFATRLANCVGVIDSDYRGEVAVRLTADPMPEHEAPLMVSPGDRVAQAIIVPFPRVAFEWAETLSETDRGASGFGSTGA